MASRIISSSELGVFQDSGDSFRRVRARSVRLVTALATKFGGEPVGGIGDLRVVAVDDERLLANVHTPAGLARMRLTYRSNDQDMWGEVNVERQMFDARDRAYWEPVFEIHVPQQGEWRVGSEMDQPLMNHNNPSQALFMLGASMLFAIVNGPQ